MENVLLIGEDAALLDARAATLEETGAEVTSCHAAELDLHLWNETYDLIILCNSLRPGVARSMLVAEIYRRWPNARILQVVEGCERAAAETVPDACFVVGDLGERGELLEISMELLGRSHRKKWHVPTSELSRLRLAS